MSEFEGRVAVITGAASGNRERVAHTRAGRGAIVAIADRDAKRTPLVRKDIRDAGGGAHPFVVEVSVEEQVRDLMADVVGPFLCSKHVLPTMLDQGGCDASRYMTGHVLPVDGGVRVASPIVADRRDLG